MTAKHPNQFETMIFTSFLAGLEEDPFDNSSSNGMTVLSSNGDSMTGGTNPGNPG